MDIEFNDPSINSDIQSVAKLSNEFSEVSKQEARGKIIISGTDEYIQAENERMDEEDPVTKMVEQHFKDKSGNEIILLGTSHRYDASDPEIEYLDKLVREISEGLDKVLILEGQHEDDAQVLPKDPAEAIKVGGGEFAYMAALARQRGLEVYPSETDIHDNAQKILAERPDITKGEVALHYALKVLVGTFRHNDMAAFDEVAPFVHYAAGVAGDLSDGGWVTRVTTRKEVAQPDQQLMETVRIDMPRIIEKLNAEFAKIRPGETLLEVKPDGTYHLLYDLNKPPILWDPSPERSGQPANKITEISRLNMLMVDRHTFDLTLKALAAGKEPIIAVGSSHVCTLRPAFKAAFTQV